MKPILEVQGIAKKFRIRHERQAYLSIRDSMMSLLKKSGTTSEEFYALNEITFSLEAGESVGIFGKNGAGKSTLLKILSKITPPTKGKIISRGRIASLLEVGTGFHPELSGRENIFLNGSILGMKRKEIDSKMDEIIGFSGIERFLDTPLKHYSSGMSLRLAFSVAAFLEPEIIIIDEVLAVGDAEFQKKCIGKMEDISKSGRTILFVSHNMTAITSLCSRCIYLKAGQLFKDGQTDEVVNMYNKLESAVTTEVHFHEPKQPGDSVARLLNVRLIDREYRTLQSISMDQEIGIEMTYRLMDKDHQPYPNIHLFRLGGECVFVTIHPYDKSLPGEGLHRSRVWIPANLLNDGTYMVGVTLTSISTMTLHFNEKSCITFEVTENINNRKSPYLNIIPGTIRPDLQWESSMLQE